MKYNNLEIVKFTNKEGEIDLLVEFYKKFSNYMDLDYLSWKHIKNIYGLSIIYYAFDINSKEIVASRALWKHNIMYRGERQLVVQPCDTLTHPDYQRQGLFTKLTEKALSEAKSQGASFACNFPNSNSKNGYLKLSFTDLGGMRSLVYLRKRNIFNLNQSG